jgi:uncharacterized repeat protein (TIGR03803 family)
MTSNGILSNIVVFSGANGSHPQGGLLMGSDGNLYGTTSQGGPTDLGTVFRITLTNDMFTTLAYFADNINNSGAFPEGPLVQGSNLCFYGTAAAGGASDDGAIFMVTTGGVLITVVSFAYTDGSEPETGLIRGGDGNFYGTTSDGGAYADGTFFEMTTNYVLTNVVSFNGTNGDTPQGPLVEVSGNFYGTAEFGGTYGVGTVFSVTPGGLPAPMATFNGTNGSYPNAGLALGSDGNLYGTTADGGAGGAGTVFQLSPTLSFSLIGGECIVYWPTNAIGFNLQFTTNLSLAHWVDIGNPSNVGAYYVVTNKIYSGSKFYRLINTNP